MSRVVLLDTGPLGLLTHPSDHHGLKRTLGYLPLDTETMLLAAELWARSRFTGNPLADDAALDGDVILAAQAQILAGGGHEVVVATTNVRHLSGLVDARLWSAVS